MLVLDLIVILLLILLNGLLAMSELAVVSARRARLQLWAQEGRRGAARALHLAEHPGRFLSTVQIGITLVGIVAGAFGGARLAQPLAAQLAQWPALAPYSDVVAVVLVVGSITYLSLVVGELVPKQLALRHAEGIAAVIAAPMSALAWLSAPLVYILERSSRLGLRLLGAHTVPGPAVTEEEIKMLVAEATRAGVVKRMEQAMIEGVMRLADRPVSMIMTPRPDVVWLDLEGDRESLRRTIVESGHARFPVGKGSLDELHGVVHGRDLLRQCLGGSPLDIAALVREPLVVHENTSAVRVLQLLKEVPIRLALVVDEYGHVEGLVSSGDVLESIVGALADREGVTEPAVVHCDDGSLLLDGGMPVDEVAGLLALPELAADSRIHTLAGVLLARIDHLPTIGERVAMGGYRFEVVDMDGRRIDRVRVVPLEDAARP